jgi:hypothetical protein
MFEYLNWAVRLEGVSPVARLLAIWMANHCTLISGKFELPPDEPACEVDIDAALAWIGCSEGELLAATAELVQQGVSPLSIVGRRLQYTFPDLVQYESTPAAPSMKDTLAIYVISGAKNVCKVGISKFPDTRLANLQSANPVQPLKIVWTVRGEAKMIRRAERDAHQALAPHALGNEWFQVDPDHAADVVRLIVEEALNR